ncbi:hypothetical protein GF373_00490, partial [bacterium]|nr:hypothetical protein [bacterium]
MKSRTIFITYFILTIALLASAVVFAFEIKHFMRHRGVDPTAEYQMQLNQDEIVKEELNRKKELSRQEVTQSFGQTQAF